MNPRAGEGIGRHIAGLAAGAIFILPLAILISGSLQPTGPADPVPQLLPESPTTDNYRLAIEAVDLTGQALRSLAVAVIAVPLSVGVAAAAGFATTRLSTRPRRAVLVASLVAVMLPFSMLIVGRVALFNAIGISGSLVPLLATALIGGSPINVVLFYLAYSRIPDEVVDAARLEGASLVQIWLRIGHPFANSLGAALVVVTFALSWGSVLEPLAYLSDERLYTLPLGVRALAALDLPRQPIMLAGAVLASVLPIVLLIVLGRRVEGALSQSVPDA